MTLASISTDPCTGHDAANTLIELVAATTVLAIALVPALRKLRDAMEVTEELERATAMSTLCVGITRHLTATLKLQ